MQPGTLRSIWRGGAPGNPQASSALTSIASQAATDSLSNNWKQQSWTESYLERAALGGSSARRKRLSEPQDLQPPGPGRPSCPGWGGGLCCPLVAGAGWCAVGRAAGPDAQAGGRQGGAGPPRGHRGQLSEELPVLHTAGPSGSQAAAPRGLPGPRERGPTLAMCSEAPPTVTQPRRPPLTLPTSLRSNSAGHPEPPLITGPWAGRRRWARNRLTPGKQGKCPAR